MKDKLVSLIQGKRVLYIATKNMDYLRIQQEVRLIGQHAASLKVLGSNHRSYLGRCLYVLPRLVWMSKNKYDVIFVGFLPQMIVPFFSGLFRNKMVIVDFFISLYDTFVMDRQKFLPGSIAARLAKWVDQKTLKRADHVIVDTQADGAYFVKQLGAKPEIISVLYLEADQRFYYPKQVEKRAHFNDRFVVLYFGSILPLQGVEVILEAALKLKDKQEIYFIIIGPIDEEIKQSLTACTNIEFIHWLEQQELSDYIAMADICLGGHFHPSIDKARRTIAGKTYIYRAMDKPVILGDNEANKELFIEDGKNIFYVEMGDALKLKELILKIYADWADKLGEGGGLDQKG